jgi:hypothetical protein
MGGKLKAAVNKFSLSYQVSSLTRGRARVQGVLAPWAKLQAMLQGIILGAGLMVIIINKVLTRFWVLVFGRFVLGAPDPCFSGLVLGYFLGFLIIVLGFLSGRPLRDRQ